MNSDSNCFHIPFLPNLSVFWCCFLLGLVTHRCTHPSRRGGSRGLFTGGGGASVVQLTLQDIARSLRDRQHKRVVVMAGAGISTPSGIPDFRLARESGRKNVSCALPLTSENTCRSPGSGLYDNLQQYDLPYAEAIFEIGFFHRNPAPFFALAKELYPGNYRPNPTHFFVHLLHQKGQLLRMYTQNIDGLERRRCWPPHARRRACRAVTEFPLLSVSGSSGWDSSREVGGGSWDVCHSHLHLMSAEIQGGGAPGESLLPPQGGTCVPPQTPDRRLDLLCARGGVEEPLFGCFSNCWT